MRRVRDWFARRSGESMTGQQRLLAMFGAPVIRRRGLLLLDLGAVRTAGPLKAMDARQRRLALERGIARLLWTRRGFILIPIIRGAAPGYVKDISTNGVGSSTSGTTLTMNVDAAPGAGNGVVVEIVNDGSGVTVSTVSAGRGNTWQRAASGTQTHAGSVSNVEIWFTNQDVAQIQLNDTITVTFSSACSNKAALGQEYNSPLTVDKTATFPSASSTTAMDTGTTAATSQAAEISIAAYGISQSLAGWTKNASYSLPTRNFRNNGANRTIMASYLVLSATGTQDATATAGTAGWSVGVIATFTGTVTKTQELDATQGETVTKPRTVQKVFTP